MSEAIERYAWASWWDNADIGFDLTQAEYFSESEVELLELASELAPIEQTCRIEPKIANPRGRRVFIYLARLSTGGVISGGACGLVEESEQMSVRSLGELLRHAHVAGHLSEGYQPQSFYEKRLAFFLTEAGESLVDDRLSQTGEAAIVLPELEVDEELQYPASDVVYVHRCLFKNQPAFVGGNLERLCL